MTLTKLGTRWITLSLCLGCLALWTAAPSDSDEDRACQIDRIEMPAISQERRIGPQGCEATYYELCEELVVQAQEACSAICRRFNQRSLQTTLLLEPCTADPVGTSIDAFDKARDCRFESDQSSVGCSLSFDCRCKS